MDLIRLLLIHYEGEEKPDLSGYTRDQLNYHRNLLLEAGLAHGKALGGLAGISEVNITRLTWEGHEFLDAARNPTIWKKVLAASLTLGGGLTMPLAKALMAKYAKELLGLDVK
ncbi:MAG: DUF2513 domain-containing protein [Verrucomicrobiia bacterium]|jgi:hypothetical protein